MADIKDPRLLWAKAGMFVILGVLTAACAYIGNSRSLGQFVYFGESLSGRVVEPITLHSTGSKSTSIHRSNMLDCWR
jgi:hypothetical protein